MHAMFLWLTRHVGFAGGAEASLFAEFSWDWRYFHVSRNNAYAVLNIRKPEVLLLI